MIILGSTGSIGTNALRVAREHSLNIEALIAGSNVSLLNQQIKEFNPKYVCIGDKSLIKKINHPKIYCGEEGILEILNLSKSNLVLNALVGFAGLRPTVEAIKLGKKIALANKETLVVAGKFIDSSKLITVDSEHFGLWYLLQNRPIKKMIITASGGSFRDTPIDELANVNIKDALNHPNWSMGAKITIDSATMINKLFELLEAYYLYGISNVDAIIEPTSLIHSIIDFVDGSSTMHLSNPDMKLPISYALMPDLKHEVLPNVDLINQSFNFRSIDCDRYNIWNIKDEVLSNPDMGVVINAANEVAVQSFLDGKISFLDISNYVIKIFQRYQGLKITSIDDIFEIDKEIRSLKI